MLCFVLPFCVFFFPLCFSLFIWFFVVAGVVFLLVGFGFGLVCVVSVVSGFVFILVGFGFGLVGLVF